MNESHTHASSSEKLNCKAFICLVSIYVTFWKTGNSSWPGAGGGARGLATRGLEGTFRDVINVLCLSGVMVTGVKAFVQNCRTVCLKGWNLLCINCIYIKLILSNIDNSTYVNKG